MERDKIKRMIIDIICYLFVLLFVYAAVNKVLEYQKFKSQIGQSQLLTAYAGFLAWFIPSIELLIVILLLIERTILIGLYAAFTIMLLFTCYIAVMLTMAANVPCSCGGILQKLGWEEHLIFNSVFVILGYLGITLQMKIRKKPDQFGFI
ncbi:MauE/DoxX family redox-associated membrane protein [Pedobacter heparinus]|uniref:MauE/DoxX family redox-associated membrane protein n=1 Tax=Pedobacter heparinus TaxID=984 RepID=UPI002931EB0C|nr:MauE/DoxX family redox-associated membrane protein [Pedobacter heparinus]